MIISLQALIFFRESILATLDRFLRPYCRKFSLTFIGSGNVSDDEEIEEQVFADYDDEKGVVFYPPVYAQRYAAVSDCLMDERWRGKLEKVVDLGYHDMSFIKYLKEVPGIKSILGVDIESIPLRCSSDLLACSEYAPKSESPLQITLYQGNAADPDFRLIGCDAVIGIEMIEHMLPHDLDRLVHTVFGFIKPWIVIFTTPNGDFNVLFKSLEKNGLRRWDHFFEWSREQFNDWSSNIVIRYPSYTVSCQGIGPGPPGTLHIGCCSQLALFVAKDYHKQQDLSLDSLALVAKIPSQNKLCEMIGSLESLDSISENNKLLSNNFVSYPDLHFSEKASDVFITTSSPTITLDTLQYRDGESQCNIDSEIAKGFLMFDNEQMCFDVLVPRRKHDQRVYHIEDISSRLNCTTLKATKFSKTTQKLMENNKIDSIVHTREVVDEIRRLTKKLNFNKDSLNQTDEDHTWNNINWGDNAPYWNQYYKVVREYNYPLETKSVDCRLLDLLSDEINRLIDAQNDDEMYIDVGKIEIPVQHLMRVVEHITDDVHKIKELLEWNGYEVVDDVLIHSRLLDNTSVVSHDDDWPDNDIYSDWDTNDVHSTLSDGSTIMPDTHGRVRRALDHKLRKLRTMLTAHEDVSTELDRVVCRLMKLTLRTSKGRQTPPPSRWMQCKLLDMLTLTEKAIERRQRYFIENYPLTRLDFDENKRIENIIALDKINEDNTADVIVDKYLYLVQSSIGVMNQSPSNVMLNETTFEVNLLEDGTDTILQRTQAWVEEDIEVDPYPNHDIKYENSSGDTDHSNSKAFRRKYKKNYKRQKIVCNLKKSDSKLRKNSQNKMQHDKYDKNKSEEKNKDKAKSSKTKIGKKVCRKKSSYNNLYRNTKKNVPVECENGVTNNRQIKEHVSTESTISKPIPQTFKELCYPESIIEKNTEKLSAKMEDIEIDRNMPSSYVAATEKSYLIDIVMDGLEETIALRRSIGTDAEDSTLESEAIVRSVSAVNVYSYCSKHEIPCEYIRSQTIFLYDINEPTTSKGIRHTSMDVQCGPDVKVPTYSVLSTTMSVAKMPKILTTGIKIGDSFTDVRFNQSEFEMSTNDSDAIYKTITPRVKSPGIRIKDSDTHLPYNVAYSTVTRMISQSQMTSFNEQDFSCVTETDLLTGSEACCLHFANYSKNTSDVQSKCSERKEAGVVEKVSATKYETSRLSCGGVYVHSYRDKDFSEDVVYQGEWQRYRSKALVRIKPYIPLVIKKFRVQSIKAISARNSSKNKELSPKSDQQKKPTQLGNTRFIKINKDIGYKSDEITQEVSIKFPQSTVMINTPAKTVSKVATKLTLRASSKNSTSKKTTTLTSITSNKNNDKIVQPEKHLRKIYLPLYLRRNKYVSPISNKCIMTQNIVDQVKKENLERSKTGEISNDLHNFRKELCKNVDYFVFRNELENKNSMSDDETTGNMENDMEANSTIKLRYSLQSQTSSTCSSPNSIATIRAVSTRPKISSNKRHSTPTYRNNLISESENRSPNRNKKYYKRCQSAKTADKCFDNKENIPESSGKAGKKVFMGRSKRIFRAQLATDSSPLQSAINSVSKHKEHLSNRSNIKIPTVDSTDHIKIASPSISKQRSTKSNLSSTVNDSNYVESNSLGNSLNNSNLILVVKQLQAEMVVSEIHKESMILTSALESSSAVGDSLLAQWADNKNVGDNQTSNILSSMRQLIEETLEFIDASDDLIDPETISLGREDLKNPSLNMISSPTSFNTVIPNEEEYDYVESASEIAQALNRTFDTTSDDESISSYTTTEPKLNANHLDQRSFKSLATASRVSEYFLADSELNNFQVKALNSRAPSPKPTSVKDIFERKDQFLSQNPGGTFANQAFSGFSIDGDPVAGDQLDHVNLIDSETGSMARQATSEEVFISGRSSESYDSCLIDEDVVVPYWLFQVISQQQSMEEESVPPEMEGPLPAEMALPMPIEEAEFDENGNMMDGVAVGAGAGDGRGMHSDHSQDSSGRGTSLSSSDMSSGPQSEAILINPSALAAQYELLLEPGGGSIEVPTNPTVFQPPDVRNENENSSSYRTEPLRNPRLLQMAASDADISSTDTDVPDSSSN